MFSDYKEQLLNLYARYSFKFSTGMRRDLWNRLSIMMKVVPLVAAIDELRRRRQKRRGRHDFVVIVLAKWYQSMQNGRTLAETVKDWVSTEELMLISAGEESGNLEKTLQSIISLMDAKKDINSAVLGGLTYPAVLLTLAFGILYLFGCKFVPELQNLGFEITWSGTAATMIVLSKFAESWLWLIFLVTTVLLATFFVTVHRFDGKVRTFLDRYPPYSIYRIMQGSIWLIAVSALIDTGIRVEDALSQISRSASPWMKQRLDACLEHMRKGFNLGEALGRTGYDFPDQEILDDLEIQATYSDMKGALVNLGTRWRISAVEEIKTRMRVVFYVSLFMVCGLLVFMIAGIFDLQSQISTFLRMTNF